METVIVWVIIGVVVAASARWVYRTISGKSSGCGCGEKVCPLAEQCPPRLASSGEKEVDR